MICSDIDPYSRKSIIRLYCIVNGIIVDNMATIYILCMKETGRHVSMLRQQERTLGSRVLEGIGASRLVSLPLRYNSEQILGRHDDVIKWKHFPRNWPFVRGIHRSSVNSLHKGQWRGALMFSLICVWINDWVNNREAGDLRRYLAHYDVIVMEEYWLRAICVKNFHIAAKFDRRQGSTAAAEPSLSLLLTTLTVCPILYLFHNSDVIMSPMASQITSLTIVCSTVYSVADQRKHQSSASLAFVRGIHRWPVNSPHKWPVTRKMFPFDDVIMSCAVLRIYDDFTHDLQGCITGTSVILWLSLTIWVKLTSIYPQENTTRFKHVHISLHILFKLILRWNSTWYQ